MAACGGGWVTARKGSAGLNKRVEKDVGKRAKMREQKKKWTDGETGGVEERNRRVSQVRAERRHRARNVHSFTGVCVCVCAHVVPASSCAVSLETGSWCWSETRRAPSSSPPPRPPGRKNRAGRIFQSRHAALLTSFKPDVCTPSPITAGWHVRCAEFASTFNLGWGGQGVDGGGSYVSDWALQEMIISTAGFDFNTN